VAAFDVNSGEYLGNTAIRDTTVIPRLFTARVAAARLSSDGGAPEISIAS
jgi:hypothetical protein